MPGRAKRKARGFRSEWNSFIRQVSGGKASGQNSRIVGARKPAIRVQHLAISKQHLAKVRATSILHLLISSGAGPSPRGSPRLAAGIRDSRSRGRGFRPGIGYRHGCVRYSGWAACPGKSFRFGDGASSEARTSVGQHVDKGCGFSSALESRERRDRISASLRADELHRLNTTPTQRPAVPRAEHHCCLKSLA